MVIVALALFVRTPNEALNVEPLFAHVPWLLVAETKDSPAGKASVTVTKLAASGPILVTFRVKVKLLVRLSAAGATALLIATSATEPAQQERLLMEIESMYQPPPLVPLLSVPQRQRS